MAFHTTQCIIASNEWTFKIIGTYRKYSKRVQVLASGTNNPLTQCALRSLITDSWSSRLLLGTLDPSLIFKHNHLSTVHL